MILITGANGLIGSAVAKRFLQAGIPVRALVRADSDRHTLREVAHQIDWAEGDILDIPSLEKALEGITYIVHTAAIVSFAPKDRDVMFKVNVEGTANVVNACLKAGIKKMGYLSSVAALGRPDAKTISPLNTVVINEKQKWEESELNSNYAKTKYQAELEVWRGIAEGLNAYMVNPTIVLGEGNWNKSSIQLFKYAFDEKPFYPQGVINYVDVLDVAEAMYQLMISDITAERFTLNAGSITYQDFLTKVALGFGKRPPRYKVSQWASQLLWRLEAVRTFFTRKSPLITKETATTSAYQFYYDNRKINKAINFQFCSLDESIERCCKYFQGNTSV
jgi:dihydroflavonol-4-reductase